MIEYKQLQNKNENNFDNTYTSNTINFKSGITKKNFVILVNRHDNVSQIQFFISVIIINSNKNSTQLSNFLLNVYSIAGLAHIYIVD